MTIPLRRPWLSSWAYQVWSRLRRHRVVGSRPGTSEVYLRDLDVLEHLSVHTLRDIGAPEPVRARAAARREAEQARLLQWLGRVHDVDPPRW
jgi:hypothetical protein